MCGWEKTKYYISTPLKVIVNPEGMRGLKSQNFKTKKPSVGGEWVFSGTTQLEFELVL